MGLMEHNQGVKHQPMMMVKIDAFTHGLVQYTPMLHLVMLEKSGNGTYGGVVALMVSKNQKNELVYQTFTDVGFKPYEFGEGVKPKFISSIPMKLKF